MKLGIVASLVGLAAVSFVLAIAAFPGGYDPAMKMMSALGQTEVRLVELPWCLFFFAAGMFFSAVGVVSCARMFRLCAWGAALNVFGLVVIVLAPQNVNLVLHDAGCTLAAVGGAAMLLRWFRMEPSRAAGRFWVVALAVPTAGLLAGLASHELGATAFAPWVPLAQKPLILAFVAWLVFIAARGAGRAARAFAAACLLVPIALAIWLFARPAGPSARELLAEAGDAEKEEPVESLPVSDDELAGLAWLERVTGPLDAAEEREWWNIGGSQHGIFAKRYNIAFAGYAAAAIGMRGDAQVRSRAGRVLGNCIGRMIKRDVWAYSQSADYWGGKPWAPDPCRRENVMYTGHLLHLLALYELFTGDRRYRREGGGWDFEWKDGRRVHYDVEKLVDVTVTQMRKGPNGGVACEPGLMFFPCNCHPHVALSIFRRLGHGDWTGDAARWEKWALAHYLSPAMGGGALNMVYHARGNFMYPRGQAGIDGWSALWYEAWASDRRLAVALWRRVRANLDWAWLSSCGDGLGEAGCCDPQPVSPSVASVFLAAAARACSDAETAARLEEAVDARYLKRKDGMLYLDLDRSWRIGATAMRLISLAEARGSRFRTLPRSAQSAPDDGSVGTDPAKPLKTLFGAILAVAIRHDFGV